MFTRSIVLPGEEEKNPLEYAVTKQDDVLLCSCAGLIGIAQYVEFIINCVITMSHTDIHSFTPYL